MALDILGYYNKHKDFYGDMSLEDVAKDVFYNGEYSKKNPDYNAWKKETGIDGDIEADRRRRNPTFEDKLRAATDHVAPKESSSILRRAIGDPLASLAKGAIIGIPEAIIGLADIPTMGYAGKGFTKLMRGRTFQDSRESFDAQFLSPEAIEAQEKVSQAKGFTETIKTAVQNPSSIVSTIMESAPSMVGGAAIGRMAMKGIGKAVTAKGITEAEKISRAIAAGAVGEGLISAGQNTEQLRQGIESGTLSPAQVAAMAGSGFVTGLISRMSAGLAKRLGIVDVDTLLAGANTGKVFDSAKTVLKRIIGSAITEGALEELPQSAQEQMAQNIATGKPILDGVAEAAAMGLLSGAGMGMMGAGSVALTQKREPKTYDDAVNKLRNAAYIMDVLDSGLKTGEFNGKPFTDKNAVELINESIKTGIYTEDYIDRFKDKYPQLRDGLNGLIADNVTKKIDEAVTKEPTKPLANTMRNLSDVPDFEEPVNPEVKKLQDRITKTEDFLTRNANRKGETRYNNYVARLEADKSKLSELTGGDQNGTLQTETEIENVAPTAPAAGIAMLPPDPKSSNVFARMPEDQLVSQAEQGVKGAITEVERRKAGQAENIETVTKAPELMTPEEFDAAKAQRDKELGHGEEGDTHGFIGNNKRIIVSPNERSPLRDALEAKKPVNAALFDRYNKDANHPLSLPDGYTKEGDNYIFKGEEQTALPAPLSQTDAATVGVTKDEAKSGESLKSAPEAKKGKGVKEEFKVGDVLDPQGKTNMVGKVTIKEIQGNTLKFVDSEGTEFSGMQKSIVRDLVKGGSWKKEQQTTAPAAEQAAKTEVTGKQPYELSRAEYVQAGGLKMKGRAAEHKKAVAQAIAEGKITEHQDYPELSEPKEIFIRAAEKRDLARVKKSLKEIPDKFGYEKVYQKKGKQGRGFYYVKMKVKEVKAEKQAPPPSGAENLVTFLTRAGKVRLGEEFQDKTGDAWSRAHGFRSKDRSREMGDIASVTSQNGKMAMDEAASFVNAEGFRDKNGSKFTDRTLFEVLAAGEGRNILHPGKAERIIEKQIEEKENEYWSEREEEYLDQQREALAQEGIDAGRIQESRGDIEAGLIEAVKSETDLSDLTEEEIAAAASFVFEDFIETPIDKAAESGKIITKRGEEYERINSALDTQEIDAGRTEATRDGYVADLKRKADQEGTLHGSPEVIAAEINSFVDDVTEAQSIKNYLDNNPDRRFDAALRKELEGLSHTQILDLLALKHEQLKYDSLTNLKSKVAYINSDKLPYQALLDLDGLKYINDTFGHPEGDKYLKAFGRAIREAGGATEAYRTGGDEFALQGNTPEELKSIINKAKEILKTDPIIIKGKEFYVEFSHGIAEKSEEKGEPLDALKAADQMMYKDKAERKAAGAASRGEKPTERKTPRTETTDAGEQHTLAGLSAAETFSLTAKEPETPVVKGAKLTPKNLQPKEKIGDMFAEAPKEEPANKGATADSGEEQREPIASKIITLSNFDNFMSNLRDGKGTVQDVKDAFNSLKGSQDAITKELSSMTKDALLKRMGGMRAYRYKNDKKAEIVKAAYNDMISDFALGNAVSYQPFKEKYEDVIGRMVENYTEADLANFSKQVEDARAEYKQRMEGKIKAIKNPETLEEFETFIRVNGKDKMTPEQSRTYDELVANKIREGNAAELERKATVRAATANVNAEIIETKHTKTGADLFVVQLEERVDREVYNEMNRAAKKMGGWYSSYKVGGAVPGFQFKTRESAEAFKKYVSEGDTQTATEVALERRETRKDEKKASAITRLREMAARITERANEELSRDRQTNTARRARMANNAEDAARRSQRIAETMNNIADAIEAGEANHLSGLRTKAQIEQLNGMVTIAQYAELRAKYPSYSEQEKHKGEPATIETVDYMRPTLFPDIYTDHIRDISRDGLNKEGVKRIAQKWWNRTEHKKQDRIKIDNFNDLDELKKLADAVASPSMTINSVLEDSVRLRSMGIETPEMERAALREFIQYRAGLKEADKAKMLERSLVGKNIGFDFFPTPKATAQAMVDQADISEGMDVLEPSAGNGNIAEVIREAGHEPDTIELSGQLKELLEAKGFNVVGDNFLDYSGKKYDRIIMNPPFSNNKDIEHVRHAYELLKPNGRIVAIMGEGAFFRNDKKATEFREWLDRVGGTSEKLAEGTFTDKSLMATTGTNARMVVIDKGTEMYRIGEQGAYQMPTIADVQDVFKGQEVSEISGGFLIKTHAGEVFVESVNSIDANTAALNIGYSKGKLSEKEVIAGKYDKGVISLVKGAADKFTLSHESVHYMEDIGVISPSETSLLKRHIQNLVSDGKFETVNEKDIGGAEDRAEFLAQALKKEPKGLLGRIINKIQDFIDKLVNAFGKRTVQGIQRDIRTGKVYGRETNAQREARLDVEGGLTGEPESDTNYSVTKDKGTGDKIRRFKSYGAEIKDDKVVLYRGGNVSKKELSNLRYGDYLSAAETGKDATGNSSAEEYGKNIVRFELPISDIEVTGAGEFQYKGQSPSLKGGNKYPPEIYRAYNDYYGSNFTAKEIDKEADVRQAASQALSGGRDEFDELMKRQNPNPVRPQEGEKTEQYQIRKQTDPPVSKDPKVLNLYLKDETDAIVQTIMNKLHPKSMTWLETMLKSPEWFDHPQIQNIVKLFMRDRNEIYHETFNDLNMTDDKEAPENTVTDAAKALRNKGLSLTERLSGKVSPEYQTLMDMIDDGDTRWVRNKKIPLATQLKHFEDAWRKKGATDEIINVWRSFRQSYDKALDLMTKQLRDMIEEIKEEAKAKGEKPDLSELNQTLKGALAQMEEWRGFYAPRQRRGNWAVQAYKEHGPLEQNREWYRAHHVSELSAQREAKKLERDGWKIYKVGETEKLPESVYQDVRAVSTAKLIDAALDKLGKKIDLDQMATFNAEILREVSDMIKSRGFRSTMIHRGRGNVVRGFIEDPIERHLMYINSVSGGISKARVARMAMQELLGDKEMGEPGIDPVKEPKAFSVAQNYIQEQLRNADASDRIIGLAKSIATFKFLGFNLRSLAVNTTAILTTAPASIHQYITGGKGSFAEIYRQIAKAGKDYGAAMAGRSSLNADEQAFIDEVHKFGWDDAQYTREALGEISKTHSRVWSTMMDASMYLFGVSEKWNRGTTMLAAYRLARKNGMSHDQAAETAKTSSDKAHGVYGKSTMPMWAQGTNPAAKLGQMMYVYSKFGHNYLQMLYDMGFKKKNIKGAMFAFLSPLVLAGGAAFPFKDAIFGFAGFILGLLGFDRDPEKWVWDQIREHLGGDAEKFGRHGLTGAMGVDISGSLSIGVGIPKDFIDLTGAIGGVVTEITEAGASLANREPGRAAEHLLPTGLANPLRAMRESKEGATTRNRRRVWDEKGKPYVPGTGASIARGFGFRSTEQAVLSERTWEGHREQGKISDRRNSIYERYRAWMLGGRDRDEYKKIVKEVQDFNRFIRENRLRGESYITSQSLKNQARRMMRPSKKERSILKN